MTPHPNQRLGCITYAQHGDDLMILNLFYLMGIEKPSYLDIGAHHPVNISNTKLLYDRGARGVNVEANPNLIEEFNKQRPHDQNVCVGVGLKDGHSNFYMYSDSSGRNTFSVDEVASLDGIMTVKKQLALPITTIDGIVNKYCGARYPDLLTVDIEGLDYDVLKTADFASAGKPKLVVVEVRRHDTLKFLEMMQKKGYILLCRMIENLFFIDSNLYQKVL